MNEQEIQQVDRITEAIYNLLHGSSNKMINMQEQGSGEIAQLSGFVNTLLFELQNISTAITDLGSGNLDTPISSKLPLANSVKSIQSTMRHLTWQTEQVAKGDFSQRVSFLGKFSSSFNWMIEELANNRDNLESEVNARTHELSLLLDATARLSRTQDLSIILDEFAQTMLHSFTYHTSCSVALFKRGTNTFRVEKTRRLRPGHPTPYRDREYSLSDFPFLERALENYDSLIAEKQHADIRESEKLFLFGDEYKTVLILPINDAKLKLGFVLVSEARDQTRSTFSSEDLGFYKTLINHLSVSINNALLFKRIKDNFINTIEALAASIDARDAYTHFHSKNVMRYSVKIAEAMNFSPERLEQLSMACLLHDIGKIGIRDAVLLKPAKLSREEFEEIKSHPVKAAKILSAVKELGSIPDIILAHHERYDGNGYPNGLVGVNIPLEARIMAIADSFDAMTTSRVYRPAMSKQMAIDEINNCAGSQFDPELVEVFMKISRSL